MHAKVQLAVVAAATHLVPKMAGFAIKIIVLTEATLTDCLELKF